MPPEFGPSSSSSALTGDIQRRTIALSQSSRSARRQASSRSTKCAGVREPEAVVSRQSREPRSPRPGGKSEAIPHHPMIILPCGKTAGGEDFQVRAGSKGGRIKKRTFRHPVRVCAGQRLATSSANDCFGLALAPTRVDFAALHLRCASRQFVRSSGSPPCHISSTWSTVRPIGCVRGSCWSTHLPHHQQSVSSAKTWACTFHHAVPARPLL